MNEELTTGADLAGLLAQGQFMFLRMAGALLDTPLDVTGWGAEAVELAHAHRDRGDNIGLEIFAAPPSGAAVVALVAVSVTGKRYELGRVTEAAPSGAAN